jgi:hypothetical protein
MIWFTKDCHQAAKYISRPSERTDELNRISTEPIAAGLREIFAEFSANAASKAADSPR